jgi:signal transduction histidine kinase
MTANERIPLSILIVEDDLDAQLNLQDILELEGYQTAAALCATDVLECEDLDRFDVILLDRKLPDGKGDRLLPFLREHAPLAAVIVTTGYANTEAAITALRHGATDFLTKPIEPEMLRARLNRIAEQRRMREELAETQRQLIQSERLAAIGQTIAALSHEARNELHGLRLGLHLLSKKVEDVEQSRKIIAKLVDNEVRLNRLFEDIRHYAAPIHLDRHVCDLREIWQRAWLSLQESWEHRDVSFEEELGDASASLLVDGFRLEQVFRNLFENSLAACSGPLTIHVCCTRQSGPKPAIQLSVRDNGPGLSQEQKQKVFAPFYTTKARGTGLGMAIVKRIVEAHEGTIRVGEEGFRGAEFIIMLPLTGPPPPDSQPPWREQQIALGRQSTRDGRLVLSEPSASVP